MRSSVPVKLLVALIGGAVLVSSCTNQSDDERDAERKAMLEEWWEEDKEWQERERALEQEQFDVQRLREERDRAYEEYISWEEKTSQPFYQDKAACEIPTIRACVGYVVEVVDGDTLRLRDGELVRLVGIDAPERYPTGDCYGEEATQALWEFMIGPKDRDLSPMAHIDWSGTRPVIPVFMQRADGHPERDRYGRLLRVVEVLGFYADAEPFRRVERTDAAGWLLWMGLARFNDYALRNYATSAAQREILENQLTRYREAENRSQGGWVACGWE